MDHTSSPVITVVMPAHNSEATLDEAVASLLAQTFSQFELIIVENGSTDETFRLCEEWAGRDSRVHVERLPIASANTARNRAIELAQGELIAFLDSDDRLKPRFLERADAIARRHPTCAAFALGGVRIDYRGHSSRLSAELPRWGTKSLSFIDAVRGGLYTGGTVVRTQALRSIGGFRPGTVAGDDYDLWLRLLGSRIRALYVASDQYEALMRPDSRSSKSKEASWERHVGALIDALRYALTMDLTTGERRAAERRIARLERQRSSIHDRRDLEDRLLRGDFRHVRRDYLKARSGYRKRSRYLLGLAMVLVSPRLLARTIVGRRRAGFG